MEHVLEWFLHAVKDTLPMLPWMFLMYVIIQLLENKTAMKNAGRFGGALGPVVGSATGLIPQCGFSVMAAKFYEQKYISLGTLLAIFFSTSDEAFLTLIASGSGAIWVLPTIAVKMAVGIAIGYGVDLFLKTIGRGQTRVVMQEQTQTDGNLTVKEIFISRYLEEKDVEVVCACGKAHDTDKAWVKYLW
ncbi:MAG: arsenic efflux protein, partial [Clostridia bacterium]|nr:arsenic efflux protein [Clostridia bacterium]